MQIWVPDPTSESVVHFVSQVFALWVLRVSRLSKTATGGAGKTHDKTLGQPPSSEASVEIRTPGLLQKRKGRGARPATGDVGMNPPETAFYLSAFSPGGGGTLISTLITGPSDDKGLSNSAGLPTTSTGI